MSFCENIGWDDWAYCLEAKPETITEYVASATVIGLATAIDLHAAGRSQLALLSYAIAVGVRTGLLARERKAAA